MPITEQDIQKLEEQLNQLAAENERLKKRQLAITKKEWTSFKNKIKMVVFEGDKFEENFQNFEDALEYGQLATILVNANNPCTDVLGFNFSKIIKKLAQKNFLAELSDAGMRIRFNEEIADAIDNPIWQVILKSNPVTLLVANVVDKIAGFIKKIKIKKENVVSIERVYDKERMKQFVADLQPYIQFYDELYRATHEYQQQVSELTSKKGELKGKINDYYNNFLTTLGIESRQSHEIDNELDAKLDPTTEDESAYLAILEDQQLIKAYMIAENYPVLKTRVAQYKVEFYNILLKYLNENLEAFEVAKKFKLENPQIDEIIKAVTKKRDDVKGKIVQFSQENSI